VGEHLRVLIVAEASDRLEELAEVVGGLGHEVVTGELDVRAIGALTTRERPDVALVGLGLTSQHALGLIDQIVLEASCPVIALLSAEDPAYVREAAKRGVFAYLVDTHRDELESAIDITLQRFTQYHNLQGAFGRRAVIEQAKGILMCRHAIDSDQAFEMLRKHSQRNGHPVVAVAEAILTSFGLLVGRVDTPSAETSSLAERTTVASHPDDHEALPSGLRPTAHLPLAREPGRASGSPHNQ
jgi:response regulator NasT